MTLRSLERGGSGVTMGAYLAVMQVLGIEKDLDSLGRADPLGRELQDARLPARNRTAAIVTVRRPASAAPTGTIEPRPEPVSRDSACIENGGYTSSQALAQLIDPGAFARGKKAD